MRQVQHKVSRMIEPFAKGDDGATAIEYALIAAATGLALVATLPLIETGLTGTYNQILDYFTAVGV